MKHLLTLLAAVSVTATAIGKQITESEALTAARKYAPTAQVLPIKHLRGVKPDAAPYYAFNLDRGYVIVSGDDEMTELVGYACEGHFDTDRIPPQLQAWLDGYAAYVNAVQSGDVKPVKSAVNRQASVWVKPMVTTKWNQDAPFNNLAPEYTDNGSTYRCATGCAATAMAQIMKFHNWPERGVGSHSYVHETYGRISADFSQHTYDWADMTDTYTAGEYSDTQAAAVALLMKDCGVALDMNYGQTSGASVYSYKSAFEDYFRYDTQTISRSSCASAIFENYIITELYAGRPLIFTGQGLGGGHAFVVDGLDSNHFLHVNWGWGGYCDGFFDMNYMNPTGLGIGGGSGAFQWDQAIVLAKPLKDGEKPYDVEQQLCFVNYNNTSGGIFYLSESTVNKGDDISFTLRNVANASGESYYGSLNVGVYDQSGIRVAEGTAERIEDESGNLSEFPSGTLFTVDIPIILHTTEIADGTYTVYATSETDGGDWRKFASTSHLIMTVGNGTVTVSTPSPDLVVQSLPVYEPTVKQGHTFSADVTITNRGSVTADGNIIYSVTDTSSGETMTTGALRSIIYDGCDFQTTLSFAADKMKYNVGATYSVSLQGFQTTDNQTLPIDIATPMQFTVIENDDVQRQLTFYYSAGESNGLTISSETFSKDDTSVTFNLHNVANFNEDSYTGYIGLETANLHTDDVVYESFGKTAALSYGSGYRDITINFQNTQLTTAACDGVYRVTAVSREETDGYIFPRWAYLNNSNSIDLRLQEQSVTVLHPVDEVAMEAYVLSYPIIGNEHEFFFDLENKNNETETVDVVFQFMDSNDNMLGSAEYLDIKLRPYKRASLSVNYLLDPAIFHEREAYTAVPYLFRNGIPTAGKPIAFSGATSGIDGNAVPNVTVYPNPAVDVLNFNVEARNVAVYNAGGALAAEAHDASSVSVANLPCGYYIAVITTDGGTVRVPFVKK